MPSQSRYDLIRGLRQQGHDALELPAIALTAFAQSDDEKQAAMAGFQVHLSKLVNLYELTEVILRLARRAK